MSRPRNITTHIPAPGPDHFYRATPDSPYFTPVVRPAFVLDPTIWNKGDSMSPATDGRELQAARRARKQAKYLRRVGLGLQLSWY